METAYLVFITIIIVLAIYSSWEKIFNDVMKKSRAIQVMALCASMLFAVANVLLVGFKESLEINDGIQSVLFFIHFELFIFSLYSVVFIGKQLSEEPTPEEPKK